EPPTGDVPGEPVELGEPDRAIEGHPAVQLRVDEVPRLVADLPDALVGAAPRPHREVGDLAEELGVVDAQLPAGPAEQVPGVEQLAERVELQLPRRAVADPHRGRAAVAGQV